MARMNFLECVLDKNKSLAFFGLVDNTFPFKDLMVHRVIPAEAGIHPNANGCFSTSTCPVESVLDIDRGLGVTYFIGVRLQ